MRMRTGGCDDVAAHAIEFGDARGRGAQEVGAVSGVGVSGWFGDGAVVERGAAAEGAEVGESVVFFAVVGVGPGVVGGVIGVSVLLSTAEEEEEECG